MQEWKFQPNLGSSHHLDCVYISVITYDLHCSENDLFTHLTSRIECNKFAVFKSGTHPTLHRGQHFCIWPDTYFCDQGLS